MKFIKLFLSGITITTAFFLNSCSEGNSPENELPQIISNDAEWFEDEISAGEIKWFRVEGDESLNRMIIEWAEAGASGETRTYTADVKLSCYKLDGQTAYFEDKNQGYGENARTIELDSEFKVLLKVELNDAEMPGTFALRYTGISSSGEIKYNELSVADSWTEASITEDETIGYMVDCSDHPKVKIVWAESGSPEPGYTAEIKGSVFQLDGETVYSDLGNGKAFLNKNKSHSNDPKAVEVNVEEKKIKIHIMVNTAPGTYAIKVIPYE